MNPHEEVKMNEEKRYIPCPHTPAGACSFCYDSKSSEITLLKAEVERLKSLTMDSTEARLKHTYFKPLLDENDALKSRVLVLGGALKNCWTEEHGHSVCWHCKKSRIIGHFDWCFIGKALSSTQPIQSETP